MSRPVSPNHVSSLLDELPRGLSSIPTELLQAIFGHVAEWPTTPWAERSPVLMNTNLRRESFRLASVCAQWRGAVLQTPELWSTIHLADGAVRDPVAYVNACLDRSAQWPIDAAVDFSLVGPLPNSEAMSIWGAILSRSSRWRRCHFTFSGSQAMSWDKWPKSTLRLEELVIVVRMPEHSESPFHEVEDQPNRLLPLAPRLKRLSFDSIQSPPITLQNLEYLSIHLQEPRCSLLWDVLSQTPLLREARIFWPHSQSRSDSGEPPSQHILLPNLQFLEMYGHTALDFDAYAETLNLPALHTIAVSSYCSYTLEALLRRVAPQVHNLVMRYERGSWLSALEARSICQLRCLQEIVVRGAEMDYVTGEDMTASHRTQTFSVFFEFLRDAPDMRQLNTLKLVNCKHDPELSDVTSFEVNFLGDSKGWADPRLALFMDIDDSD